MTRKTLLFLFSLLLSIEAFQAQTIVTTTAGNLNIDIKKLTSTSLSDIKELTVKGTIDARDFRIIRDSMNILESINLCDVSILEFKGYGGTWFEPPHDWVITGTEGYCEYGANAIPQEAFLKGYKNGLDRASYKGKKTLKSILLPGNLTNIEKNAFNDCTSIISFTIAENAINYKSIDGALFNKNATELCLYPLGKSGEFTLPATITKINPEGIVGCKFSKLVIQSSTPPELTTKDFTATVVSVPAESRDIFIAHEYWGNFTVTEGDEELIVIQTNAEEQLAQKIVDSNVSPGKITKIKVVGPINWKDFETLNSMSVLYYIDLSEAITTHIPGSAFHGNRKLNKIILPATLKTIGDAAFANCSALEGKFTLPESVEAIYTSSFYECKGITEINFPASLSYLGGSSFYKCELTKVDFSACRKLAAIGIEAFYACSKLENVLLPPNVKEIEKSAFANTKLKEIILPDGITTIGANAFSEIPITTLAIPSSIVHLNGFSKTKISQLDFSNCIHMESIGGFYGSVNLQVIDLSPCKSLKTIEEDAFRSVYSIHTIQPTPPTYDAALTTIVLPESLDSIKDDAFECCEKLVTVDMSKCKNLKYIGAESFQKCRTLKSLEFPSSFNYIGFAAFRYCSSLASLTLNSKTPPSMEERVNSLFYETPINKATLTIPKGTKAQYAFSVPWNKFGTINESNISIPDIPSLDIKLYANGFSEYMAKDQNIRACIYFTSSDTTVPVCFRYRLKDIDWKSKVTLSHAQSTTASETPFQFDDQGIAWIDTPDGYEVKNGQLINYIIPKFLETGVMDYEIAVYDQTKTTKYATFDCSVQAINTVNYSLPEIKGAKDTDIPFTLTVANAGDFAGKKVKVQISAYKADTDSTTIQYVKEETQEAIKLASSQSKTMVEVEHIIPSLSATSYQFTFRSTCNLSDQDLTIVLVDPSNDLMIPDGKTVKINITDKAPEGETTFTSGALTYKTLDNSTVAIAGITDATKTEYTIPSTVMHNNKNYTVTKIGEDAFVKATGLLSIDIPSSVITIEKAAFAACEKLQSVTLHEGLKTIGREAFSGCASLQSIDIPASVTQIEEGAIEDCLQLSEITVKEGNQQYTSVDGVLFNNIKNKLLAYPNGHGATYTIPSNVTCIGRGAFAGCEALTDITIPEGVRVIEQEAFKWCSGLTSITIPESIVVLNILDVRYDFPSVFEGCDETLQEIHWKSPTPIDLGEYGQHVFFYYSDDIQTGHSTCKLFVPKGSKAAYKNAPGWKYFKNIIEEDEDEDNSNKPLTPPSPESDITISGDSTYTDADGTKDKFNGTIGSDEKETVINTLVLNGSISTATTIVFNHVTVGDGSSAQTSTSVTSKTNVVIELIGDNSLGKLVNDGITKLTGASNAALHNTTVVNNGVFTDETTFITQVEGPAGLNITAPTDREVTEGSSVTLTASTKVGATYSITFIWEELQTNGTWIQIAAHSPVRSSLRATEITVKDQLTIAPEETCQYRCRIKNEVGNVSTTLTTVPATVTVNPTDVGNATIDSDNKVYVHDGGLYFQLTTPTEAQIIHFNGTVMRNLRLPAGETRVDGLTEGFYIIRYKGNKTVKVTI